MLDPNDQDYPDDPQDLKLRASYKALHKKTVDLLTERITSREATPADVSNAIKLLNNNQVVLSPFSENNGLQVLEEELKEYDKSVVSHLEDYRRVTL